MGTRLQTAFLVSIIALQVIDLVITLQVINVYGVDAEANWFAKESFKMGGILGGIAFKASLLAVIFAGAVLNPKHRNKLLLAAFIMGCVGIVSGLPYVV